MKIKLEELNIRISNEVIKGPPDWSNSDLVFDFPIQSKLKKIYEHCTPFCPFSNEQE